MTPPDPQSDPEVQPTQSAHEANVTKGANASGGGLSVAALVLALAALVAAGYALWQFQSLQSLPQKLSSNSGRFDQRQAEFEGQLASLTEKMDANSVALSDQQTALAAQVAATADAGLQLDALEQRMAGLTGSDKTRRNNFLRAEALYYLRVANARVLLAHDAVTGASALQLADEKLRQTGDPALTPVRAKLSEELAALRAVPTVDRAGISFRLQSLASQVSEWPLRNPVPDSFSNALPESQPSDADAWSRVKETVKSAFGSIVSIRESDVAPDVQLSAAQQSLVLESVRAELQVARLTLLSGNTQLYAQSLQNIAAQIPLYFDMDATAVQAAHATVNELLTVEMPGDLPDVSGSLQLLLADENGGAQQ